MVIAAVMAPSLMAQSLVTGDITGTVTDPSGAVVSGATVTLKSDANGSTRNTTSGSNGTYRFPLLSPGSYTVTVTASGFSKAQSTAQVNVGQAINRRHQRWQSVAARRPWKLRVRPRW